MSRKYVYKIIYKPNNENDIDYLFTKNYYYYINQSSNCLHRNLDITKLSEIAQLFQSETFNFSNFTKYNAGEYFNPIRKINKIDLKIVEDNVHHNTFRIYISFYSKSFLRHQIRIIVNSMLDYACGKISKEEIIDYLNLRKINGNKAKAPSEGLYLADINYDEKKLEYHNLHNEKLEKEYIEYRDKMFNNKKG